MISAEALDEDSIRRAVAADRCGAVVSFCGTVRNHDGGRAVLSLEYHAHPDASRFLAECCSVIAEETGVRVAAAHRVGALEIGDIALCVAAGAEHRAEAFAACEKLVEAIKTSVPIWKRQHFADSEAEWVGL